MGLGDRGQTDALRLPEPLWVASQKEAALRRQLPRPLAKQMRDFVFLPCCKYTEKKITAKLKSATKEMRKQANNFHTKQPFV